MKLANKYLITFLCLMWVGILINASSHFNLIRGFFNSEITLISLINLIRASSVIITVFLIIILNLKEIKIKKNLIFTIFYFYIFIQLVSFLLLRDINLEFDQFYFLLNQLLIIYFFHIIISFKKISDDKLFLINKFFFYILIVFILAVIVMLGKALYLEFLSSDIKSFYYGYFVSPESIFLDQQVPRITGIARLILVLIIFISIALLYSKFKISSFLILSFLISMLFLSESRFSIYCFFILSLILLIFDKKYSLLRKIFSFLLVIFIANFINFSLIYLKNNFQYSLNFFKNDKAQLWIDERKKGNPIEYESRITQDFTSSGRSTDWLIIIQHIKQKPIIGYGFQADRYLTNNTVSNAYLYSFVSGGIFGFLLFTLIVALSLISCFRVIFFNKIFEKKSDIIVKNSVLINIMLVIRTIIENSFSVYNFDLILFLLTFLIINLYEKNPQKYH